MIAARAAGCFSPWVSTASRMGLRSARLSTGILSNTHGVSMLWGWGETWLRGAALPGEGNRGTMGGSAATQ
jgi:hypothetical protein